MAVNLAPHFKYGSSIRVKSPFKVGFEFKSCNSHPRARRTSSLLILTPPSRQSSSFQPWQSLSQTLTSTNNLKFGTRNNYGLKHSSRFTNPDINEGVTISKSEKPETSGLFITTPIFYVNAEPHLGHLYTSVIADAYNRYQKLCGRPSAIFSTGTDEHGMKIEKAAKTLGIVNTLTHCDNVSSLYRKMCLDFSINHSDFIRTTEERHRNAVQHFWKRLENNGTIYKSHYEGWYCLADESFLPESNVSDKTDQKGKVVKISTESGHPVEWNSEENYMFRLKSFLPDIQKWIVDKKPIKPEKFGAILSRWIEDGFEDLSVSRPKSRLSWGIPVPGDPSQVIYVWLDALVNYLTVAGYPEKPLKSWPPSVQIVGKDILKFHGVYWPAFLLAAGLDLPREIVCHSHWTVDSKKMSKSLGNVVNPFQMGEKYGTDGLRYFLLREGTAHSDANFTEAKMHKLLNSELADTLGNLLSRCSGKIVNPRQIWPSWNAQTSSHLSDNGLALKDSLTSLPDKVSSSYDEFNFYRGLEHIMATIRLANLYVEETKPWALAKESPTNPTLHAMISLIFEVLRVSSIMTLPIVPNLSCIILDRLNISPSDRMWTSLEPFLWDSTDSSVDSDFKTLKPSESIFYRRIKQ